MFALGRAQELLLILGKVSNNFCQMWKESSIFEQRHEQTCLLTEAYTNQAVQPQKMAKGLTFHILEVEGLCYLCSKKSAYQLLCFCICRFSHDAAHLQYTYTT